MVRATWNGAVPFARVNVDDSGGEDPAGNLASSGFAVVGIDAGLVGGDEHLRVTDGVGGARSMISAYRTYHRGIEDALRDLA